MLKKNHNLQKKDKRAKFINSLNSKRSAVLFKRFFQKIELLEKNNG
jgi:hypothetical protein